jgi:hypothetical protein
MDPSVFVQRNQMEVDRMTPEELGKFTERAYLLGSAVAESYWSVDVPAPRRKVDKRRWAVFYMTRAATDELKRIANTHFWDGYDDMKNRIGVNDQTQAGHGRSRTGDT